MCNAKVERLKESDLDLSSGQNSATNPSTDPAELNERISIFRKNNYTPEQIRKYGIGSEKVDLGSINNPEGYMKGRNIAVTRPNFLHNTSNITYSAKAAKYPYLLGKTMAHETAHSYVNRLTRLLPFYTNSNKTGLKDARFDTVEHVAIKKLENFYYKINLNGVNLNGLNIVPLNTINNITSGLSPLMQGQINSWSDKLFEIFNRKVTYQGISW